MKRVLLFLIIVIPMFASSQDTLKIPSKVGKKIVKELVYCDSVKAVLGIAKQEIATWKMKSAYQDTLLVNSYTTQKALTDQLSVQTQRAGTFQELYNDSKSQYNTLSKEYKTYKRKAKFTKFLSAIAIGVLTYLAIIK